MNKTLMGLAGLGSLVLFIAGCGRLTQESQPIPDETATFQMVSTTAANPADTLPDTLQPVNELANGEYHWSQLLVRDAIAPIYDPQFAPADEAPYDDDELVIGVEINGEAKAYAIGPLNSREMVNDTVSTLAQERVVNDFIGPYPVVLYANPETRNVQAYLRQVDNRLLTFSLAESGEGLIDAETGSEWDVSRGLAREGQFQGQVLLQLPYLSSFDWAWLDFHPNSEFYR